MHEDPLTTAFQAKLRQVRRTNGPTSGETAATQNTMVMPVVRDTGFAHLKPDRLNIIRLSSDQGNKYELRLQSFVCRETSQRINSAPGGALGMISRDSSIEVRELGTVDLTLPQMQKLRDDLTREIYTAQAGSTDLLMLPPNSAQGLSSTAEPSFATAPANLTTDAPWDEAGPDAPVPSDASPAPSAEAIAAMPPHPLFDELSPEPFPTQHRGLRRFGRAANVGFWLVLGGIGLLFYYVDPLTLRARLSDWPNATPPLTQVQAEGGATKPTDTEVTAPTPATLTPPVTPPDLYPATTGAPALPEAAPPAASLAAVAPVAVATPETTPAVADPAPPAAVPQLAIPHLAIVVRSSCWIIVSDASGTVYLEKLMKPGETWTVPPVQGLELRAGNAGATSLVVDGVTKPPLGADNALWTGPIEG